MGAQNWQRDPSKDARSPAATAKSTVGTALKFMYKPRFGRSIGEIGRTSGIFTRMIAGVFMTQGLFPRQHPAFKDESIHLSFADVILTSFRNLNWTKDGMPQVAFFFAVIGTIIFSVIGFILALTGMFTTQAHAGIVDAPFPLNDAGNLWLEHIFNDGNFTFFNNETGADYGMLTGDGIRTTPIILKTMAAMYANVMLILAVIILFYHLIAMVVHTAHEGTVMGRNAHQIWAPVRLVFALGLLVPVADGWSSGQWLVMQIAKWGSGMASNIWNLTSEFPRPLVRVNPDTLADGLINHLEHAGRCVVKDAFREGADGPAVINDPNWQLARDFFGTITNPGQGTYIQDIPPAGLASGFSTAAGAPHFMVFSGNPNTSWWTGNACGIFYSPSVRQQVNGYGTRGPDAANLEQISAAYITAFNAIQDRAFTHGVVMALAELRQNGGAGMIIQDAFTKDQLKADYKDTFVGAIGAARVALGAPPVIPGPGQFVYDEGTNDLIYKTVDPYVADQRGWMSAGMYFMDLVGKQSHAQRMVGLPVVSGMPMSSKGAQHAYTDSLSHSEAERNQEYQKDLTIPNTLCGGSVASGASVDLIKKLIYCVGFIPLGLMDSNFQMTTGRQFAGTGNTMPFTDMVNFGGKLINSAKNLVLMGLALQTAAAGITIASDALRDASIVEKNTKVRDLLAAAGFGVDTVKGIVDLGGMLSGMLISFGVMMFFPGFILFYLLPALPFINFVLGCITWMVSLLMATIAIPVIAIAHLTPNGEGLPSASARGAYYMILQIFLRPIMMIFGLYVCILLANTGLVFASVLFNDGTNTSMTGTDPLSQLMYFILYAGLCYAIVNASITCIDEFPLKSVAWVGGGSVDQNHPAQTAIAGAIAGQSVAQQLTGGLSQLRYGGKSSAAAQATAAQDYESTLVGHMKSGAISEQRAGELRSFGPTLGTAALEKTLNKAQANKDNAGGDGKQG